MLPRFDSQQQSTTTTTTDNARDRDRHVSASTCVREGTFSAPSERREAREKWRACRTKMRRAKRAVSYWSLLLLFRAFAICCLIIKGREVEGCHEEVTSYHRAFDSLWGIQCVDSSERSFHYCLRRQTQRTTPRLPSVLLSSFGGSITFSKTIHVVAFVHSRRR
jgi:hypothetical protein